MTLRRPPIPTRSANPGAEIEDRWYLIQRNDPDRFLRELVREPGCGFRSPADACRRRAEISVETYIVALAPAGGQA